MIIILLDFAIFLLVFLSIYLYLSGERKAKLTSNMNSYLKKINGQFSYDNIEKYLRRCGNPYNLTPLGYILGKVLVASILLFFSVISSAYFAVIPVTVVGYFLLDILLWIKDKKDTKQISFQFRDVYDLLNIQMTAGTFIGTALVDCYLVVSNPRFKKSLAILSAEISVTKNISQALKHFAEQYKENNDDITNFVMTIEQSIQTGQSKEQLIDMSENISDMAVLAIQEQTEKVKSTSDNIKVLIFIGILVTIVYFVSMEIGSVWTTTI
ncbi:type II secretion system F family protein [Clostridium felsineum]|uniref:hypothetical protein n=1 Tax=Clostridium felsineum TaxID=36839 RepID=UPI00214D9211|nr:hypothetical protein [Clostridium felsineum]MCR3758892.1 type II secretion system F family protein [Clostridium felsineum]